MISLCCEIDPCFCVRFLHLFYDIFFLKKREDFFNKKSTDFYPYFKTGASSTSKQEEAKRLPGGKIKKKVNIVDISVLCWVDTFNL